jgi:2'-deoxynucleoside 5'-phosphate N-hydrolase
MKIYFAGSIRGGREHQEIYAKIIKYLENFGKVLTEHVGEVALSTNFESQNKEEYIYTRDTAWIKEADVLIAEVTSPSLGVGYEIAYAEKLNKPILCLFGEFSDKSLSAMIQGNKDLTVRNYKNFEDAKKIIDDFLSV